MPRACTEFLHACACSAYDLCNKKPRSASRFFGDKRRPVNHGRECQTVERHSCDQPVPELLPHPHRALQDRAHPCRRPARRPLLHHQRLGRGDDRGRGRQRDGARLPQQGAVLRRDGPVLRAAHPQRLGAHAQRLRAGGDDLSALPAGRHREPGPDLRAGDPARDAPRPHQPQARRPCLRRRHRTGRARDHEPVRGARRDDASGGHADQGVAARSCRAWSAARARWPAGCSRCSRTRACCAPPARPSWSSMHGRR